ALPILQPSEGAIACGGRRRQMEMPVRSGWGQRSLATGPDEPVAVSGAKMPWGRTEDACPRPHQLGRRGFGGDQGGPETRAVVTEQALATGAVVRLQQPARMGDGLLHIACQQADTCVALQAKLGGECLQLVCFRSADPDGALVSQFCKFGTQEQVLLLQWLAEAIQAPQRL